MADNLAIVNRVIGEHRTIRGHVRLVGDSISDLEAFFSLQKAGPDWILSSPEALSEKKNNLLQTLSALAEGLKNHFGIEDKFFLPLCGELLMQALKIEHQGIKKQIEEAKSLVAKTEFEGLSQKELLSKKAQIQQKIEGVLQSVEEHASREETLLKMLKKTLEAKS